MPEPEAERAQDDSAAAALMKLTNDAARLQECTDQIIEWLHQIWLLMRDGRLPQLQPDPFYERAPLITEEVVENVIAAIEEIFVRELKNYPAYHRNAQGVSAGQKLVPPGFDKLDYTHKLAVVQGIDRIFQGFDAAAEKA